MTVHETVAVYDSEVDKFLTFKAVLTPYYNIAINISWVEQPTEYADYMLFYFLSRVLGSQLRSICNTTVVIFNYNDIPNFLETEPILDWLEGSYRHRSMLLPRIVSAARNFE